MGMFARLGGLPIDVFHSFEIIVVVVPHCVRSCAGIVNGTVVDDECAVCVSE